MRWRLRGFWIVLCGALIVLGGLWWQSRASLASLALGPPGGARESAPSNEEVRATAALRGRSAGASEGELRDGARSSFELSREPVLAGEAGRVRLVLSDAAGEPEAGVPAFLGRRDTGERSPSTSDHRGELCFEDVPTRTALRLGWGGGDWIREERDLAPLAPGERRDLGTLVLRAGHALTGRVLGPEGGPAAGAHVALVPKPAVLEAALDPTVDLAWRSPPTAEATSDEDGAFALRGVPDGTYTVLARDAHAWAVHPRALRLPEDREEPIVLTLLTCRGVVCRVLDDEDRPAEGSKVAALPDRPRLDPGEALHLLAADGVPTDSRGEAAVELPPGTGKALLLAHAPGRVPCVLEPSATRAEATFRLPLAHALRGRATDSDGSPLADAAWELEPYRGALPAGLLVATRTSADPAGAFAFEGLPAGSYRVHLEGSAGGETFGPFDVPSTGGPLELRARAWAPLVVRTLDDSGSPLSGATVEAHPPTQAEDAFVARGSPRRVTTDARGEAALGDLAPGTWLLRATRGELVSGELSVEIGARPAGSVDLVLEAGGSLVVEVRDAGGGPVPRARLRLERPSVALPPADAQQESDAFGHASWSGLGPGAYEVVHAPLVHRNELEAQLARAHDPGPPGSRVRVDVLSGHVTQVRLRLRGEPVLRVRVTRAGRPAAGARVDLARCGEPAEILWRSIDSENAELTDGDGRACLVAPSPGCYLLQARSCALCPATTLELDLPPGSSAVDLELASGRVSGRVLDGRLDPLAATRVRLVPRFFGGLRDVSLTLPMSGSDELPFGDAESSPGDQELRVGEVLSSTDAQGRFEFAEVPPGTYALEVEGPGYAPWSSDDFELEAAQPHDLGELRLEPSCRLEGVVRGLEGRVRPGQPAVARLYTPSGRSVAIAVVGQDGSFALAPVPPGPHELRIELEGEVVRREAVAIRPGPGARLELEVP